NSCIPCGSLPGPRLLSSAEQARYRPLPRTADTGPNRESTPARQPMSSTEQHLKVLRLLQDQPDITQRQMPQELGTSLLISTSKPSRPTAQRYSGPGIPGRLREGSSLQVHAVD